MSVRRRDQQAEKGGGKIETFIFDIEVFKEDWIVVFRPIDKREYTVIHNDNYALRKFLNQPDILIGGFNNKHYDDYILLTMLNGGDVERVKACNDWIIGGKAPWEFPFIQGVKKPFKSFDLRDDIPDKGLSLKAIEGNLLLPIVESSVPFTLDRKLTAAELEEVIRYCQYDVESTFELYKVRKENYIDAKALVGEMYGVPYAEALGMTNAKLSARVLNAKAARFDDERDYKIPGNIDTDLIPPVVLNFFLQINDKTIPDAKLFGAEKGAKGLTLKVLLKTARGECPITYAWGGVHGAKPCITVEETPERVIINQDVGSLYPNSMINFGYCSRAMSDPEAYQKLVKKRLGYKHAGDKVRADALKLVVNTVYGAMLNQYNDLADRLSGRSVCITNQLAMTMLIVQLAKSCKSIDFININTDGVMFSIDRGEVDKSEKIVADWCKITRFEMERDDFVKVIQKDVNNYIGIKADGKIKTKGGFVSLYGGGSFKTNSLSIIHKAIVDNLVYGVKPEKTIQDCKNVFAFQQIIKTGSTFDGAYHYIDGQRVPIQKVNRVYAVKDSKYGEIVKGKTIYEKRRKNPDTGIMESVAVDPPKWQETTIPECPAHAYIDNTNVLTVDDLDLGYYIDMAYRRIDKYINIDRKVENEINKITEVIEIMATVESTPMNVYAKLALAREKFLHADVKKSGVNRFAEFKYFELADIVPPAHNIFGELGLLFHITFTDHEAVGTLVNLENPEDKIVFTSPMVALTVTDKNGDVKPPAGMNSIQALGGSETYQRRYLYMMCLDIVEADVFDATSGKDASAAKPKANRPATPEKREEVKSELLDADGPATDLQVKSIKNGLKKLREKGDKYEGYVTEAVRSLRAGVDKKVAEQMLKDIGAKLEEMNDLPW